jgi:hypothetical protein
MDTGVSWVLALPETERIGLFSPVFAARYLELKRADGCLCLYHLRSTPEEANSELRLSRNLLPNGDFAVIPLDGLPH